MTKTLYILLTVFSFVACARPQYLSPETSAENANSKARSTDGCVARFKISNACVNLKWEVRPTENTFGSFIFTTAEGASGLLKDLTNDSPLPLKIILWMPSMGHGSSPVTIEKIAPGVYRARDVFFNMKADWEIRFQIGTDQAVYAIFI